MAKFILFGLYTSLYLLTLEKVMTLSITYYGFCQQRRTNSSIAVKANGNLTW